jgi:hypothetical protein
VLATCCRMPRVLPAPWLRRPRLRLQPLQGSTGKSKTHHLEDVVGRKLVLFSRLRVDYGRILRTCLWREGDKIWDN